MPPKAVSQAGRGNERGEISLSLITWKAQYWHSHWLRWMNLIYLPFEAQMTSWYSSLSLYRRRPLFFPFFFFFLFLHSSWNLEMHRKTSEGILTGTNLFRGPPWLESFFFCPHISPPTKHLYDHKIALIMGVYVCVQLWPFIAEATSGAFSFFFLFMPMGNNVLKAV